MNTIGVVGDVDETSIKIDALLVWTSQQLRRFVHEHDGSCGCRDRKSCQLLHAVLEELSFRLPVSDDAVTVHTAAVPPSEIPCTSDPAAWDVDVADAGQLQRAIGKCAYECPIFAACKAAATDPRAMVWAGIAYDDEGRQITLRRIPGTLAIRDINEHNAQPTSTALAS